MCCGGSAVRPPAPARFTGRCAVAVTPATRRVFPFRAVGASVARMGTRGAIRDHAILMAGAVVMGLPLWLALMAATREGSVGLLPGEALQGNLDTLARRLDAAGPSLGGMLGTSALAALWVGLLTTAASFLAAFAMVFARLSAWPFWLSLATLSFPVEARMIPTFEVAAALRLVDTLGGLVLPVLPLAVGTFAFRQHLATLPPELAEAARLDGAGPLRFLRDFAVPLSWPMIGAVFAVAFTLGWNQYLWPLMISVDNAQFTLMRGFGLLGGGTGASFMLAAISLLPPLALVAVALRLWRGSGSWRT